MIRVEAGMPTSRVVRLLGIAERSYRRWQSRQRDGRPVKGTGGRMWVAAYDTAGTPPYDFVWVAGRRPGTGAELAVERRWAGDHQRTACCWAGTW